MEKSNKQPLVNLGENKLTKKGDKTYFIVFVNSTDLRVINPVREAIKASLDTLSDSDEE